MFLFFSITPLIRLLPALLAVCASLLAACQTSATSSQSDSFEVSADSIHVTTHTYATKGEELELDIYRKVRSEERLRGAVIFVHGGGFYAGTRKEDNIAHFCDSLARSGYVAINMDYRLFLKGESFHCDQPIARKIQAFATAANDIRSATLWILDHADTLRIDADAIFLAGSSAGAEAALHAAYWTSEQHQETGAVLPADFRFRGIMAFAGALEDDELITPENALPTLLYHGSCDPLVPYDYDIHHYCPENTPGALPLYGSYALYRRLREVDAPVRLVTRCGGKHGSAVSPIENDIPDILRFLRLCMNRQTFTEHEVRYVGKNNCRHGNWSHCD